MEEILFTMLRTGIAAGDRLLRMQPFTKEIPSQKDFLTKADTESEMFIVSELTKHYPCISAVGEEGKTVLTGRGLEWCIDPLDGSVNYAMQDDFWGINIAVLSEGSPTHAVVILPGKKMAFVAMRNAPATVFDLRHLEDLEGMPLRVSRNDDLKHALIWTDHVKQRKHVLPRIFNALSEETRYPQIRLCCAASLMWVALGIIDGYVHAAPEPWDIAAPWLILERAGGHVTDQKGGTYRILDALPFVASNGILHPKLLSAFKKHGVFEEGGL